MTDVHSQKMSATLPRGRLPRSAEAVAMKEPLQNRSRASFERMMAAAEVLMIDRGFDNFTLNEVAHVGQVSIGSIYNRFASKDEMIQAVANRALARMEAEQGQIVMRARTQSTNAANLVKALIGELGEFLRTNASVMRPLMLRAAFDKVIQDRGRVAHDLMAASVADEMLLHRESIHQTDPERAVASCIRISYAAFARELNFGMAEAPQDGLDWDVLKADMAQMAATFLFGDLDRG